ncbi:hypothetical protein DCC79_09440, partial [bacterium]
GAATDAPPAAAPEAPAVEAPTDAAAAPIEAPATEASDPYPATEAGDTPGAADASSGTTGGPLRLVVAPDGNEARYTVTEQLARLSFPSDAVGTTRAITGQIVLDADGKIVSGESKFVVDLTGLTSDSNRRDGFIQRETLATAQFPTAEFVPSDAPGLPSPLPTSGEVTFQLVGDMTVRGTTTPTTWDVTATVNGQEVTGSATTRFTFGAFGLAIPQVMSVLSIEDDIRLQYDFRLIPE